MNSTKFLCNRYTGENYEMTNEKAPRGGLYVMLRHTTTGAVTQWHRGNLKTCFTPCGPVEVTAAKSHAVEP